MWCERVCDDGGDDGDDDRANRAKSLAVFVYMMASRRAIASSRFSPQRHEISTCCLPVQCERRKNSYTHTSN